MTDQAAAAPARPGYRFYVLAVLILVYMLNFLDRQIIGILGPRLIEDFGLTDTEFGGYRIRALSDSYALWQEGLAMRHCIADYVERCVDDGLRVFHLQSEGSRDCWTLALEPDSGVEWRVHELRGNRIEAHVALRAGARDPRRGNGQADGIGCHGHRARKRRRGPNPVSGGSG